MNVVLLSLPFPPSGNAYWRVGSHGKPYATAEAKNYKARVLVGLRRRGVRPFEGPVELRARFYFPNRRGDLDNRLKVLLDALEGTVYTNDRQVKAIDCARLIDRENPRVEIDVEGLPEDFEDALEARLVSLSDRSEP